MPTLLEIENAARFVREARSAGEDPTEEFCKQHDLLGIERDDFESATTLAVLSGFVVARDVRVIEKNNLKIWSRFSGENSGVDGEIEVEGVNYTIETEGSASDRGTHAKVNGQEQWWCNEGNNAVENAVEEMFGLAYDCVNEKGDVDDDWNVRIVNGIVESIEFVEEDDDED